MFHTYTHTHAHTHFPQVAFGGKAILRFFNKVPFFQSSQQCYHPLFLYGTDFVVEPPERLAQFVEYLQFAACIRLQKEVAEQKLYLL